MSEMRVHQIGDGLLLLSLPIEVPKVDPLAELTDSERSVAEQASQGLSNAVIAKQRGASPRTVANQLAAIYRKLGISGRRELRALLGRWSHE